MNWYIKDQALQLKQVLFNLSVSLICHSDYAKELSSFIYYTEIHEYNIDYKQRRKPQDYTTILADIQFCIQIIMLKYALPTDS